MLFIGFPLYSYLHNLRFSVQLENVFFHSSSDHSYQAKPLDTLDLCQLLNNDLATTVKKHPKRFIGLGTLPMQAPDLAVKEMHRCVNELGFPGVQIGSHINNWDLNSPELFPVYAVS